MNLSSTTSDIVLARGELLNLDGAEGARIVNRGGTVWITQDGDLRDIVLRDGDEFELDRSTPAIVQAFELATALRSAEPATRPAGSRVGYWGRHLRAAARRMTLGRAWA